MCIYLIPLTTNPFFFYNQRAKSMALNNLYESGLLDLGIICLFNVLMYDSL